MSLGALARVCLHGSADGLTIHSNLATLPNNCNALPGPCLCLDKPVIDHCLLRLSPVYGVPGSDAYPLDATHMSWRLPRPGSCCLVTVLSWPCSQAHLCQPAVMNWIRHPWLLPRRSLVLIKVIHKQSTLPRPLFRLLSVQMIISIVKLFLGLYLTIIYWQKFPFLFCSFQ